MVPFFTVTTQIIFTLPKLSSSILHRIPTLLLILKAERKLNGMDASFERQFIAAFIRSNESAIGICMVLRVFWNYFDVNLNSLMYDVVVV